MAKNSTTASKGVVPDSQSLDPHQLAAQAQERRKAFKKHLQQVMAFALPLGLVSVALGGGLFLAGENTLGLAAGGGLFALGMSYRYPRAALWFFLLYMPFAGTVTYWIAGGNALFQLAKDAFYFPALLAFILTKDQPKSSRSSPRSANPNESEYRDLSPFLKPASILPGLWAIVGFCILSLLLVSLRNQMLGIGDGQPLLQGILGFKVFVGYVPLIFVMQRLLRRQEEFFFLMRSHSILAIICCCLCLMQLMMLQSGRCAGTDHLTGDALFVANLEAKCLVGGALLYSPSQGVIRLPGTFVAPWQWGWFLIGNAYISFANAFCDPVPFWRGVGFLSMGAVTMGAVISGQRIALALVPVSFVILLFLTGQITNLKRLIPIAAAGGVAGTIAWIAFPEMIQERIDSFVTRWQASPADAMINDQFGFVWKAVKSLPLGRGLGTATNSCRIFGDVWLIETWFPKVLFEVGVVGLGIFLIFVTILTVVTFLTYRSIQDPSLRSYGACLWVFILFISYQTYYYPLDVDPVAVYYWVFVGAILRLPDLERQRLEGVASPSPGASANPSTPPPRSGRFRRIREPSLISGL